MRYYYAVLGIAVGLLAVSVFGCTTTHDLGEGRYLVPRAVEERSLFGTNMGFAWVENCSGQADPNKPGMIYNNCYEVTEKVPMSSQGQGGQLASGLLNAAGFWGLGALMPGGSVSNTASTVVNQSINQSVTVPQMGHHGHK